MSQEIFDHISFLAPSPILRPADSPRLLDCSVAVAVVVVLIPISISLAKNLTLYWYSESNVENSQVANKLFELSTRTDTVGGISSWFPVAMMSK